MLVTTEDIEPLIGVIKYECAIRAIQGVIQEVECRQSLASQRSASVA
jgi:hypothetical protein